MYAIASLLDPGADQRVRELWDLLEGECGLSGVKLTPLPHFSWQIAEDYDMGAIEKYLDKVTRVISPFLLRSSGIGIFNGSEPVIFLNLVKDKFILQTHQKFWNYSVKYSHTLSALYSPSHWMPHITLANRDISNKKVECAIRNLLSEDLDFKCWINEIAILYDIEDQAGISSRYKFRFQ